MTRRKIWLLAVASALALSACAQPSTVLPTVPPTAVPTERSTAATLPPTASPTAAPTNPATATVLPTTGPATPQSTPASTGIAPVPAASFSFDNPVVFVFDADGNMYLSQCADGAPAILKIDPTGRLTPYASIFSGSFSGDGGPALSAGISCALGIAFDHDGNLYVADANNNRIRRIDRNGIISTVAGKGPEHASAFSGDGGPATDAQLTTPKDIAFDAQGNLYITDAGNNRVRKVDKLGIITTFAGTGEQGFSGDGGPATAAVFSGTNTIAIDALGNVYIADPGNSRIRKVDKQGIITTIAGNGGPAISGDGSPATAATLSRPTNLAFDAKGNLYFSEGDSANIADSRIRKIDQQGIITTVVGTGEAGSSGDGGPATSARVDEPNGVGFDPKGDLLLADGNRIRQVDKNGIITTLFGNGF